MNGTIGWRIVTVLALAAIIFGVTPPSLAAEPPPEGDGIGTFGGYNPAKHTVMLGEQEVRLSAEASSSLLQQVRRWEIALSQKQPFRAKFTAQNGVIQGILIEPRSLDTVPPRGRAAKQQPSAPVRSGQ